MTQHVYAQVAHVWAAQSQSDGRSNNGNLYFRGKTTREGAMIARWVWLEA